MAAMSGMQGGRPNIGAILSGRGAGQGPSFVHNLTLQLASPRRAAGAPSAEHIPPADLGAGPSLPLVTPQAAAAPAARTKPNGLRRRHRPRPHPDLLGLRRSCSRRPAGRDRSRPPVQRPGTAGDGGAQHPADDAPCRRARRATYGDWPNQRSRTTIPATGSLVGDHVVRGNYSPEIHFALNPSQDFLPPIRLTSNSAAPSGAVPIAWQPVANARAYYLTAFASRQDATMVMWSSSEVQANMMGFDYLSEG
jgi:hypothetical protein